MKKLFVITILDPQNWTVVYGEYTAERKVQLPRKKHSPEFKAKAALEAFKGQKILTELSSEYGVHTNQRKKQLQDGIKDIFSTNSSSTSSSKEEKLQAKLY